MTADRAVPMKGARLGSYEINAAIGSGGMGEVYRATDTKFERDVAIKGLPAVAEHNEGWGVPADWQ